MQNAWLTSITQLLQNNASARILLEALLVAFFMSGTTTLPALLEGKFHQSRKRLGNIFLLIGTGGISALVGFELLPEVFSQSHWKGVAVAVVAWLGLGLFHKKHVHADHHCSHSDGHYRLFLGTMIAHCIANGLWLASSSSLSEHFELVVLFALLAHKAFESASVAFLLHRQLGTSKKFIFTSQLYAFSVLLGAILGLTLPALSTYAWMISAFALGSLMSCLISDFILPSYEMVRTSPRLSFWLLLGVLITLALEIPFSLGWFGQSVGAHMGHGH